MLRVRTGRPSQVLRMTAVALLLLSCVRVIQPFISGTAGAFPQIANHLKLTRNVVLEVGGGGAKLVRPLAARFREALLSFVPTLSVLQLSLRSFFVRVWPEHRQSFFRRILPAPSDAAH